MQWVEGFEGLADLNGSREYKSGKGVSGFGFAGKGMGYRGRRRGFGIGLGLERGGRRPHAFGRGFGRGRGGGGYPGYGYGYGNAAASVGRAAATPTTSSANVAGPSRSDTGNNSYTNANMDLEEGEMFDGNIDLNLYRGKNLGKFENDLLGVKAGSTLSRTESALLNVRAVRGRGIGFGRGRGRGLSSSLFFFIGRFDSLNLDFFRHYISRSTASESSSCYASY